MKFSKLIKAICFVFISATVCASCNRDNSPLPHRPKYLLSGSKVGEDASGDYEYYSIDNEDTYAVGLKSASRSKSSIGSFPTEYNDKAITAIWRSGFRNSQCTSIEIPSTNTVIDCEAFMESKITAITIPATVNEIGEGAFYSCKWLAKAVMQNTTSSSEQSSACSCVQSPGSGSGSATSSTLATIPAFCFFNCHELKEVVFPETITTIGEEAFRNCRSLYSTLAFMSIEDIRYRAFEGCSSLTKIYISSSFFEKDENENFVGVIGEKAFDACNSNLIFYLVGEEEDIEDWLDESANADWNQKSALTPPGAQINAGVSSATRYTYYLPGANAGAKYTNDWIYTIDQNNEVDISSYIGPTEINATPIKFITFPNDLPNGSGNYVRTIAKDALDTVRGSLERIYLPKNLRRIDANMFDSYYTNLIIVDDNTKCSTDEEAVNGGETLTGRIILNGLTDLEVIGASAFVTLPHLTDIKKLYLPYSLKGVGTNAFGSAGGKHMQSVTDFQWDYDDTNSALEVIGRGAFYELGRSDSNTDITKGAMHQGYLNSDGIHHKYELTTLIIPRTFRHFGITSEDATNIPGLTAEDDDANFGISAFAGCPLLSKVVFKGSKQSTIQANPNSSYVEEDTFNLVLTSKTFAMNESLRTVVFEERVNKNIVFNTYGGSDQPVIGWSSGKAKNDFGGDPALQTLVLPNKYTTLRIQNKAFIGNSRGVIYMSNGTSSNIKGCTTKSVPTLITTPAKDGDAGLSTDWRRIGRDSSGYNFNNQNQFGIDQKMPMYGSVLYKDTIVTTDDVVVGYGNTNLYIEQDKCAFVTNGSTNATMTNYLYDRYETFNGTATIPYQVGTNNLKVVKIGDSAFSADYCDNNYNNVAGHSDLTEIRVPDTVTSIGEYALMRAYGVVSFSSYHVNTGGNDNIATGTVYSNVMPSKVTEIGKHAFAFCNIEKILKIPNNCVFYENKNANGIEGTNITSVFTNNFSLRQVTFLNSSGVESTASAKYTTTTYTHDNGDQTTTAYTSAIYSTDSVPKNKKTLLLVLNRDTGDDRLEESDDLDRIPVQDGDDYGQFNGRYGYTGQTPTVTQYLYGAFKMCYWVKALILGNPNTMSINQPLISGLYNKTNNKGKVIYLETSYNFTSDKASNLETVSFVGANETPTSITTPPYSFSGCDKLASITLPRAEQSGVTIPAGLFASVGNPHVVFRVPQLDPQTGDYYYDDCDEGVLDLTHTNYSGIDANAFKESGIKEIIAPITTNFTVEEDAFGNCSSLTKVDFSNVTDRVIINGAFRNSTLSNTVFDFGSSAKIVFGKEAFYGCTFKDNTFEFPTKTAVIGDSCFEECGALTTITTENNANLTDLEKVTVAGGTAQDNNQIFNEYVNSPNIPPTAPTNSNPITEDRGGYKQIGNFAFFKCKNLTSFPFSKFTTIERIGHYAFSMNNNKSGDNVNPSALPTISPNNATICSDSVVDLPSTLTNLGVGAFNGSKIVKAIIRSSEMRFERGNTYTKISRVKINLGGHQFESCPELKYVIFTDANCAWTTPYVPKGSNTGQDNYFSHCPKLEIVNLPRTFEMQHWADADKPTNNNYRPDSMIYESKFGARFYLYHTLNDWNGNTICRYWHNQKDTDDNLVFYVGTVTDIANCVNNVYSFKTFPKSGQEFWTMTIVYGEYIPVYLGTATNCDPSTGVVTFSSGYTLNGSTFTAP